MDNQIVVVVSGILKNMQGKILLLKRSNNNKSNKGFWQFPEGKMQFGEKIEETLKRELEEETGLKVTSWQFFTILTHSMKIKGVHYHIIRIVIKVGWQGNIKLTEDHIAYEWFRPKEVKNLKTLTKTKKIIGIL